MNKLHAIGDSHVLHMGGIAVEHHICDSRGQGATAHNLIEYQSTTGSRKKTEAVFAGLDPTDTVLMSFGEVDCRLHLRSMTAVGLTVARYTEFVGMMRAKYPPRIILCAVIGAVPQRNKHHLTNYPPPRERGAFVLEFNSQVREWCGGNGCDFLYLDTHDEWGALKPELTEDTVHLHDEAATRFVKGWKHDRMCPRTP
jgi:hypothetical protein